MRRLRRRFETTEDKEETEEGIRVQDLILFVILVSFSVSSVYAVVSFALTFQLQ